MKIVNDTPMDVFTQPVKGPLGNHVLNVVVKGTFRALADESPDFAPEQIPVTFGDKLQNPETGGSTIFEDDLAPFKPRADVVIAGKVFAPKGRPVQALDVGFRVGKIQKVIRMIGNRHWRTLGLLGDLSASVPEPFTEMELIYENAFGGVDMSRGEYCAENPVGCGFFSKRSKKKDIENKALPNLEDPHNLIRSWKDMPKPVGFGFIGKGWAQRLPLLGSYDEEWKKNRYPERPEDFQFHFYNAAPSDQQVEGYLQGDENVGLFNMTPDERIEFQLPGIRPLVSVSRSFEGSIFEDVQLNLDTLCLMPAEARFYLVWRGMVPIDDLNAPDVARVQISM